MVGNEKGRMAASRIPDSFCISVFITSWLLTPFLRFQCFNSKKTIPYELPVPARKLNPTTRNAFSIWGMGFAMSAICFTKTAVRSMDEAGGSVMFTKMVPISSSGTKLEGVVFISQYKPLLKKTTAASTIHFLVDKNRMDLLYLPVKAS